MLPECVITHCVDPPDLPDIYTLAEDSPDWVPVLEHKTYSCIGKKIQGVRSSGLCMYVIANGSEKKNILFKPLLDIEEKI